MATRAFTIWNSPADRLASEIRMGRGTTDLPRSVQGDDYAHCRVCGTPGLEYEAWMVFGHHVDYEYQFPVCDACVLGYRNFPTERLVTKGEVA